jgi:hypothetical protein
MKNTETVYWISFNNTVSAIKVNIISSKFRYKLQILTLDKFDCLVLRLWKFAERCENITSDISELILSQGENHLTLIVLTGSKTEF